MRKTVALFVLLSAVAVVFPQDHVSGSRSSGYYFRPPRSTFYYRPDYLFQPLSGWGIYGYGSGYGLGYGPSPHWYSRSYWGCPGYSRFDQPADGWSSPVRRAYSTYLQSPTGQIVRSNSSDLVFRVSPPDAQLYLDGKMIGRARDYRDRDRYMVLEGMHELRVESPGYRSFRADLNVEPNRTVQLDVKLDPAGRR